ncbi:MAG: pyridoxal-phosphate dependent enzyme [Flavobacteriaceae bacterium]
MKTPNSFFNNIASETIFLYSKNDVSVYMKREDLLHQYVSGNKFRKLKYNILEAQETNKRTLLTFGGAFSNHISATAYAGKICGFKTIGIIRGDELGRNISQTLKTNEPLQFAHNNGMAFKFISREDYRKKHDPEFIEALKNEFGNFYLIPEGGTNPNAIKGCREILQANDEKFNYICTAVGTGGTILGILNSIDNHQTVLGFPALKGDFLNDTIKKQFNDTSKCRFIEKYHFGGFAKVNEELILFINVFKKRFNIQLDPIYTGKMMFGIDEMISSNYFKKGTSILAIHTGGLQGIAAMNSKLRKKGLSQIKN